MERALLGRFVGRRRASRTRLRARVPVQAGLLPGDFLVAHEARTPTIYSEEVKRLSPIGAFILVIVAFSALAQTPFYDTKHPPQFEDFPIAEKWTPPAVAVRLTTASEKMFRTNLTNASKEPPNFAGHFRFTFWGCGSNCGAGAVVDLSTGSVFPPPLGGKDGGWDRWIISSGFLEGSGVDYRLNSRLVVVKCGFNYCDGDKANSPDRYYFVWESGRFRRLLFVSGKRTCPVIPTKNSVTVKAQ